MPLCVWAVSCVRDPDPSLHTAPEILDTSFSVEGSDVRLRCSVSRDDNIKSCGFYFGLSEEDMKFYDSDVPSDGEFTAVIGELTYGIRYFYRPFISNGSDSRSAEVRRVEIDRQPPFPSIRSLSIEDGTTAVCEYSVADHFSGDMIICGLCWSTSPSPTISLDTKTLDGSGYGIHKVSVKGLTIGETYYFRAYAVNGAGTAYSDEVRVEIMIPFEDEALGKWMSANWDRNSDGVISPSEASLVTKIDIVSDDVRSLKGIEYLPNLDTLRCRGLSYGEDGGSGGLSEADLKANAALTCLDLSNNRLTTLELAGPVRLNSLALGGNVEISGEALDAELPFIGALRSLDISGCRNLGAVLPSLPSLEEFRYDARSGVEDCAALFRKMRGLRRLFAADALTDGERLYLLPELETLDCAGSPAPSLNLRYNAALRSLNADGCDRLSVLDLNTNPELVELHCMAEGLSRLELLEGHEIDGINVSLGRHRYIPETVEIVYTPRIDDPVFRCFLLDSYDFDNDSFVSRADAAEVVSMLIPSDGYPGIASLHGIEMFSALESLNISGQRLLAATDLSGNGSLKVLVCDNTSLSALDLGGCPALESLYAQGTALESLDLSRNPALREAYLSYSPIKTLYLTATQLETVRLVCDAGVRIVIVE